MSIEVLAILGSVALLFAAIMAQSVAGLIAYGPIKQAGPRDGPREPTVFLGRTTRTVQNQVESLVLFVPVALLGTVLGAQSGASALGAMLYLGARAVYLPAYWLGIPFIRTVIFTLGIVGTGLVAWPILQA